MTRAEGYDLHLYCDKDGCTKFEQIFAHRRKDAYDEARDKGWRIGAKDICPECSGKPDVRPTRMSDVLDPWSGNVTTERTLPPGSYRRSTRKGTAKPTPDTGEGR